MNEERLTLLLRLITFGGSGTFITQTRSRQAQHIWLIILAQLHNLHQTTCGLWGWPGHWPWDRPTLPRGCLGPGRMRPRLAKYFANTPSALRAPPTRHSTSVTSPSTGLSLFFVTCTFSGPAKKVKINICVLCLHRMKYILRPLYEFKEHFFKLDNSFILAAVSKTHQAKTQGALVVAASSVDCWLCCRIASPKN